MDYTCSRHGYTSGDDRNAIRGSCCLPVAAIAEFEMLTAHLKPEPRPAVSRAAPAGYDELVAAARAVVESYQEEIPGTGTMGTEEIDRLRKALHMPPSDY